MSRRKVLVSAAAAALAWGSVSAAHGADAPKVPLPLAGKDPVVTSTQPVPHGTRVVEDSSLPAGVEVVVTQGQDGVRTTYTASETVRGTDGTWEQVSVTHTEVTSLPVENVVRRGTNAEVVEGVSEKARQIESARQEERRRAEQERARERDSAAQPKAAAVPSGERPALTGGKAEWMKAAGIPQSDWEDADFIVAHESSWNPYAVNPSSGATGLCQSLPAGKMASAGADYLTNPVTQLRWCDGYARSRYGSWAAAKRFWVANRWW